MNGLLSAVLSSTWTKMQKSWGTIPIRAGKSEKNLPQPEKNLFQGVFSGVRGNYCMTGKEPASMRMWQYVGQRMGREAFASSFRPEKERSSGGEGERSSEEKEKFRGKEKVLPLAAEL